MKIKLTQSSVKKLKPSDKPYEVNDTDIKGFLLRVQPSGTSTYYISYRNQENKRTRYRIGSSGNLTPTQARDIAEKLAGRIANNEDIQAQRKLSRIEGRSLKYKTLGGFIEHKYKDWILSHRKSGQQTLDTIKRNFQQFYTKPLTDINTWIIDKWRTERIKSGTSKNTINRDIAALRSALSRAVEWGLIESHPLAKLKPLKVDSKAKIRYLSTDETKRLRDALRKRDKAIKDSRESGNQWRNQRGYTLLPNMSENSFGDHLTPMTLITLNTGLRRGELFNLNWLDINYSTKTLTIIGSTAKSGLTRHIPLNQEAIDTLKIWQEQTSKSGLVFPSKSGKPFYTIKRSWRGLLKDAKIADFRWHDLRHDFASKLVMAGVPLNTARELLGHADLTTTLRYAHLAPDHKAEAVAKLNDTYQG